VPVETSQAQRRGAGRHSRRRLLRAGVGGALVVTAAPVLAGCDLLRREEPAAPPADPLTPLRDGALALAVRHERAALAQPALAARLTPIAAAHRAHAAELDRLIGAPSPSATGPDPGQSAAPAGGAKAVLAALRAAEREGHRAAAVLCREAPAARAALLGSIAAARASHREALR
jgi:hypothetical protein